MKVDVLIVGSGVAGLYCALNIPEKYRVLLISKTSFYENASSRAQGGIAAVTDFDEDSLELHYKDTLKVGYGINNPEVVRLCVDRAPKVIDHLKDLGVPFSTKGNKLDLGREAGHSKRRIVHAGDITGEVLHRTLLERVEEKKNVVLKPYMFAIDLVTTRQTKGELKDIRCLGAYIYDIKKDEIIPVTAKVTVLATGGCGKVYLYTSNPDTATGDGIAIAYRAGASVSNMEFFQFHPTCLYSARAKNFLLSEAMRGEGGVIVDKRGHRFMPDYHPDAELAPRDVVARAIDKELKKSGDDYVFLDMTHLGKDFLWKRFPKIGEKLKTFGIDFTKEPIPVVPAAHYCCGGVVTDMWGKTYIDGLFVIGESAYTGLHGANRLASNSLLEALVFGERAASLLSKYCDINGFDQMIRDVPQWYHGSTVDPEEMVEVSHNWDEIRRLMWNYVGIVRSNRRLMRARRRLSLLSHEIWEYYWDFKITTDLLELRNIALVAELIVKSAMWRLESRGLHYNLDYPYTDDKNFKKPSLITPV